MDKTQKLLEAIIIGAKEIKAENLVSLNFSQTNNSVCDYYVICNAESERQITAIADSVQKHAFTQAKEKAIKVHGYENAHWVIVDYGGIVVHIFQTEYREKYKLEDLWGDAKTVQYKDN